MEWKVGGVNVLSKQVDVGEYLYTGQSYTVVEQIGTFNCNYGGHS